MKKQNGGYIAIISSVIISTIIVTLALSTNLSAFWGRFATLDREYHKRSVALAEGCVDLALLKLANNPGYAGNELVTIGGDQCTISSVLPLVPGNSSSNIVIKATSTYQGSWSVIKVIVATSSLSLVSWDEIPNPLP